MNEATFNEFVLAFPMRRTSALSLDGDLASSPVALDILFLWGRDCVNCEIAKAANVDFKLPKDTEEEASSERPRKREVIADRKGRRVMVERSADADESEARPPRAPRGGSYKGRRDRPGRG